MEKISWACILPVGNNNAISAEELTKRLNFKTERDTRKAVMAARLSGVPICSLQTSGKSGYFLPDAEHLEEVQHSINNLRKRAFSSLKQARTINRWLLANGGCGYSEQITIEQFLKGEEDGVN